MNPEAPDEELQVTIPVWMAWQAISACNVAAQHTDTQPLKNQYRSAASLLESLVRRTLEEKR